VLFPVPGTGDFLKLAVADDHGVKIPGGDFGRQFPAVFLLKVTLGGYQNIGPGVEFQKIRAHLLGGVINSIATLREVLKSKETRLLDSLYSSLPEDSVHSKIYKLRKSYGLSRVDFAARIGVHCSTIKDWDDRIQEPTRTSLKKICAAFGLDISYFEFID